MNIIHPWKIQLGHFNLATDFGIDVNELNNEVFMLNNMATDEDIDQKFLDPELIPILMHTRDQIITPKVCEYSNEVFEYDITGRYEVETNAKWIPEGEGLFPHYHPGSCISAIVYPSDSVSGLNMFDPRVNACRGYPKEIRDKFFSTVKITPRAGDVYIFPSYIQHSVSYVKEDVRLSLLHEYYLRKNV